MIDATDFCVIEEWFSNMNMLQNRLSMAGLLVIVALVLFGCGGGDRDETSRPTVADPRVYAIEALQTMDKNNIALSGKG